MVSAIIYSRHEQLYENHLKVIKNVKFTSREIDIIACILHNRGEKKIAALFLLSPRTISTHVYNIMGKLGFNSKDQIIDFIENSGKLPVFREYYVHLLLKSNLNKLLPKIANRLNNKVISCYCSKEEALETNHSFYQAIQVHLKLANIKITEVDQNNENSSQSWLSLKKITDENYYHTLLAQLSELVKPQKIDDLLNEFYDSYKIITQMLNPANPTEDFYSKDSPFTLIFSNKKLIYSTIFLFSLASFWLLLKYSSNQQTVVTYESTTAPQIIENAEKLLKLLKEEQFSANNVDIKQASDNRSLIKKYEKILDFQNNQVIQDYFRKAEMSSTVLLTYLYNLQALSSYYMYNYFDGTKAKEILLYAKQLAENYVNTRSNINTNFDQLTEAEILAELNAIQDLPQMYTRLVYSLGRTYIYTNESIAGQKYFELAKYLGQKLGLFEGYLSNTNGLLIVEKDKAELHIKEGKIEQAIPKLQEIIKKYNELEGDNSSYIIDYKPELENQQTVIPAMDPHNLLHCESRTIELYGILITITESNSERSNYVQEIAKRLQGNQQANSSLLLSEGLFKIIDKVPAKKTALLYNVLGNTLLILVKSDINDLQIKTIIKKHLYLTSEDNKVTDNLQTNNPSPAIDNLQTAELLFEKALAISRNADYTKADACDGLAQIYQQRLRLNEESLTEPQKLKLISKVSELANKRDEINKQLNRKH